jgi:hypothetical protein
MCPACQPPPIRDRKLNHDTLAMARVFQQTARVTSTTPNQSGNQPLPNEKGARAFLKQLRVAKHADAFGNDDAFHARNVKVSDRVKHRYGHPYADFDNQPNQPNDNRDLANPTLNVHAESVFMATDAVGQGFKHQWRIYNALTNEWVSPMMLKNDAEATPADLNGQFHQAMIAESIVDQPAPTKLPTTKLEEGLLHRDDERMNRYLDVLNRPNFSMSGSIAQTSHPSTAVNDLKQVSLLIEKRKQAFQEDAPVSDELQVIHGKHKKKR